MGAKASLAIELLVVLIIIVLTSGIILFLISSGTVKVKTTQPQSVLDTEFIPYLREGTLAIKDFKFCQDVTDAYQCVNETSTFTAGDIVYFYFVVESSTYNGEIKLVENYQVKTEKGAVLWEVDAQSNYYYDLYSQDKKEKIIFKDYLFTGVGDEGSYTLELVIDSSLLNKKTKLTKQFNLKENEK